MLSAVKEVPSSCENGYATIDEAISFFEDALSGGKCSKTCVICCSYETALTALRDKWRSLQPLNTNVDRCCMCGEIVPEGTQVCRTCQIRTYIKE